MHDAYITSSNVLSDEEKINLNVLGALMMNGVGGHVDNADVVAVDQRSMLRWSMELEKKLSQPGDFNNAISHNAILGFGTRSGNRVLPLRRPGN